VDADRSRDRRSPTTNLRAAVAGQARLAADKIAARRDRAASARDYIDGYGPGGRSENIDSPPQGQLVSYLARCICCLLHIIAHRIYVQCN
jgi:hypothetical protein